MSIGQNTFIASTWIEVCCWTRQMQSVCQTRVDRAIAQKIRRIPRAGRRLLRAARRGQTKVWYSRRVIDERVPSPVAHRRPLRIPWPSMPARTKPTNTFVHDGTWPRQRCPDRRRRIRRATRFRRAFPPFAHSRAFGGAVPILLHHEIDQQEEEMRAKLSVASACLGTLIAVTPLVAHHSFAAEFDEN
jgi:hypothetical protein